MGKKKLDELFQDKFLDFKEAPDQKVWAAIEASLDKKKKKRIIPLWWTLGGIAAAIIIGLMLFNPLNYPSGIEQIITDVEENNSDKHNPNDIPGEIEKYNPTIIDSATITNSENINSKFDKNKKQITNVRVKNTEQSEAKKSISYKKSKAIITNWVQNEAIVASPENTVEKKDRHTPKIKAADFKKEVRSTNTTIVETNKNTKQELLQKELLNTSSSEKEKNGENKIIGIYEKAITDNDTEDTLNEDPKKKSILEELAVNEEEEIAAASKKKWSAGPSVAPVYFNAIGEGSSVNSIFVPNSKSGNINFSYGLTVAYKISPKLTVRSGIHKVDYGYDTNEVAFSSSLTASTNGQIDNINYVTTSKNLVVTSKTRGSANTAENNIAIDFSAKNAERDGVMSQQMGYVEVPLELNYVLLNNKFGLNLIGGLSSLFLVDNSVTLTSGNLTTEMGTANNINNLNFSANIGLGVHYKFSQKVQLNIEPIFKYQLNTFSETDGTFNPYSLGVYSSIRFRL